ncbi:MULTISPECIES: phospholipase D family protein [Pseudomonas]|uniref:phospholipase D family protein n=1 Tax=Pseudomonas TaxID=286 RepID=UPI0012BD00DE|nr:MULTISPECIES: phospholipase D family protein [Pseudomonas putida group]MDN4495641.1 phospholipase D family protein [Pseudomonas mosselii]
MKLLLLPENSGAGLQELYHRALRESEELYILSAYLTDWDTTVKLGRQCKSFAFIVGKDFGITRKAACAKVIEWLPSSRRTHFLVAELIEGFHPKAMFWREPGGSYHALAGSSNLSKAAFATNHEVNAYSKISRTEFESAKNWILEVKKSCVILSQSWLDGYIEAKRTGKRSAGNKATPKSLDRVFDLRLPPKKSIAASASTLDFRRSQMITFKKLKKDLVTHFRNAAKVQKRWWTTQKNDAFYHEFRRLWDIGDGSRFQANGWERRGKDSDFRELSISLLRVIDAKASDRDDVVMNEIDRLTKLKVATRRSVFTEMLCQFFPSLYHLDNEPISAWMTSTGCKIPSRATAGYRYLEAALLLRAALHSAQNKKGGYPVENLGVLDALLWDETRRSRALLSD